MAIIFNPAGGIDADPGENLLTNPTSLEFGSDGRLYVAEQNGTINAFTVSLSNGEYDSTAHEVLMLGSGLDVVKSIQNHNDDGSLSNEGNRQVTGLLADKNAAADAPVLYISSSDPRISVGNDSGLDTNSGVITRVSWNTITEEWDAVDIVRGLPRSEENHSVNGMQLSADGSTLYVAVGGNTNNGGPDGFFAYTNEYTLSGTVLAIDLNDIDSRPILTDPIGGQGGTPRSYVYDLPTLDDPNVANDGVREDANGMDVAGPWGGNDGFNQAILPADAPLSIYASGARNHYDLILTENGFLYTLDNGSNGGLGDAPNSEGVGVDLDGDGITDEAISTPSSGGPGEQEPLYLLTEGGYFGHPAPVRANQNQSWTVYDDSGNPDTSLTVNTVADISELVPAGVAIPEGFLIDPSRFQTGPNQTLQDLIDLDAGDNGTRAQDFLFSTGIFQDSDESSAPSLGRLTASANGITEYTNDDAFDGDLKGDLLIASFDGNVYRANLSDDGLTLLDTNGVPITDNALFNQDDNKVITGLTQPLDVTTAPDGTVWVVERSAGKVSVHVPSDVILPGDNDFDNDGILDQNDPFYRDASNGGLLLEPGSPILFDFVAGADAAPGPDTALPGGLTGIMINGTQGLIDDFVANLDNVKFTTAAGGGLTQVEQVSSGDPFTGGNDGQFLLHTGVSIAPNVGDFTIKWTVLNPGAAITSTFQQIGGYIGLGDQSNYLKVVAIKNTANTAGIQTSLELNDSIDQTNTIAANAIFDVTDTTAKIFFELNVDVVNETATPTVTYENDTGPDTVINGTSVDISGTTILDAIKGDYTVMGQTSGLAVGLFSSNNGGPGESFAASFDEIEITANEAALPPEATDDEVATGVSNPIDIPVANLLANDTDPNPSDVLTVTQVNNPVNGSVSLNSGVVTFTPTLGFEGEASFEYTLSDGNGGEDTGTVTVTVADRVVLYRVNAGGEEVAALESDPVQIAWAANEGLGGDIDTPEGVSLNTGNISTHPITNQNNPSARDASLPDYVPYAVFNQERWDPSGSPEMLWSFDVATGNYQVNLFLRNGFDGTSAPDSRVFDIEIEGTEFFSNIDLSGTYGHQVAAMLTQTLSVTDGSLDIEFLHDIENPLVNAIEIIQVGGEVEPPKPIINILNGDQNVGEGDGTVQISISSNLTIPADETVTVNFEVTPGTATEDIDYQVIGATLDPMTGIYSGSTDIAGSSSDTTIDILILQEAQGAEEIESNEMFNVAITSVSANAELGTAISSDITILDDDSTVNPGDILFRINAGGAEVAANDGGPAWGADQGDVVNGSAVAGPASPFLVDRGLDGTENGTSDNVTFGVGSVEGTNTTSAPDALFTTERFSTQSNPNNIGYAFDVSNGDYVVNLYFDELFFGLSGNPAGSGARIFDVEIEDNLVLDNFQSFVAAGNSNNSIVESFDVTVSDGTLNIELLKTPTNNPHIAAIEIIAASDSPAVDSFNNTPAPGDDWSGDNTNPDDVTLNEGVNTLIASGELGDADYVTFTVAAGQEVTSIKLADYEGGVNAGFLGIQTGDTMPTQTDIENANATLDGGTVYNDTQIGDELLPLLSSNVVEGAGQATNGLSTPLSEGTYTLWFNQNQNLSVTTLEITSEAVTPLGEYYLPNSNGNFIFEAEDGLNNGPGGFIIKDPTQLEQDHDQPSNNYIETSGNFFGGGAAGNGETLTYKFMPESDGFIRINLISSYQGDDATEENDAWTKIQLDGVDIPALSRNVDLEPFNGYYKTYQSGGDSTDWNLANKNVDFNGQAIVVPVEAGKVYDFLLSERSSGFEIDKIALEFFENDPGNGLGSFNNLNSQAVSQLTLPGAEISGRVFADANDDNVDNSEPGVSGVSVELLDDQGSVIATALSATDGSYSFTDLADGTYSVRFPTDVEGDLLVLADQGADDTIDSDADQFSGETIQFAVVAGDVITDVDAGYDTEITLVGSAILTINEDGNGIETSNFGNNSFQITNNGDKNITAIEIDVSDAILPDAVFDPFGLAGDLTNKILTINTEGGTGVTTPMGGFDEDAIGITYLGSGGILGYETIRLEFTDFNPGETLGFAVDMDPNSIAGAAKGTLDSGAPLAGAGNWDVGGIGGAELIGSSFTVEYDDASTSLGKLQGQGTGQQIGAKALSTQATDSLNVTLEVNGLAPGSEGTYQDGGPTVTIQGMAGEVARVTLAKGFIVPFTNNFPDTANPNEYHDQLDAQLAALAASGFPANNIVEFQYQDVTLDGTVQDISNLFDFTSVAAFDLSVPDGTQEFGVLNEAQLPLGFAASVIDPVTDLSKGEVTSPIHLIYTENTPPDAVDDEVSTDEATILVGDVLADNINGPDTDPDVNDVLEITEVNGESGDVGQPVMLTSGAMLTLNSDGTFSYDPSGAFDSLALGETDTDSFTYTLSDGLETDIATVNITINGLFPATDIDGDGILNIDDPFAYDGSNGLGRSLLPGGEFTQDFNTDTADPFSPEGGFTGILVNPDFDYGNPVDPATDPYGNRTNESDVAISGGTLNILSTDTDAFSAGGTGTNNTLADGYQSAVDVSGVNSFEVHARASSSDWFTSTSNNGFSQFGITVGAGGTDDFVKLVISDGGNNAPRVQLAHNTSLEGGEKNYPVNGSGPAVDLSLVGDYEFRLIVDKDAGTVIGQIDFFASSDGTLITSFTTPAATILPDSNFVDAMSGTNALTSGSGGIGYGVFVSDWNAGASNRITAEYDFLTIRALDTDLALTKEASDLTPEFGENVTFTLTVNHEGGIDATGVQVEDLLANGYTFVSAEGDGTYDDLTGIWDIGTILSGQSASIEITASINESTVGDAVVYRVNPGGTTQAAADSSSLDWLGDTAAANLNGNPPSTASYATGITLTGGQKFGNENNSPTFDLSLLPLGTAASAVLFETERFGVPPSAAAPQEWDFEVENGTYTVNLYFAEIFANAPGARVFDIEVEGNVLEDYDIFVAAGNAQNKAILESFTDVMVNDGNLDIDFTTVIDNAKISAIEIIQQDVPSDYSNYAQILTADQSDPDSTAGDDSNGDDDDASITLTPIQPINDVSIIANMDAEEPGTNGEFIVSLENIASTNTTVTYSIMGTAENGVDYELLSGEVIIAQGDLEASIPVTIIDDLEVEGVESVMIELTGASGDADIGLGDTTSATVMITDDDVANEINIVATADAAEPATNGQFKISLDNAASTDTEIALTVEVTSTATADIDYTALPASVMIMQGETEAILDLTILDDIDIEGTETVQVTLDNIVSGDANLMIGAMNSATVNILDDDFNYGASVSVSGTTTFGTSSFTLTNNSDPDVIIKSVQFDILTSTLSLGLDSSGAPGTEFLGAVWDPTAEAGDEGGQAIKFANNDAGLVDEDGMVLTPITADNGYQGELENYPFTGQLVGGNGAAGGFGLMTLNFDNFDATENFIFGIDVDPQSIQNATGTGQAGAVSGGEIAGTTVTITFENASGVQQVVTQQLELTGLNTSEAIFTSDPVIPAPIMNVVGLTETERRVETSIAQQTVEVTGVEAGAIVELYFVDASGYLKTGGDGTETIPNDPFHANQIDAAPSILSAVANELGVATFMIDLSNGVAGAAPALVDDLFFLSAGVVNEEGVLISQLSEAAEIALVENASPIAIDDEFENVENAIILGNVLIDNGAGADSDPEEDPISVVSGEFMTTEGGSFTVNEFGDFIYIPLADFTGTDTVEYTLEDSLGGSDIGTVTFTVSEDDPIANDDAFSTKPSGIAVFNVLNNDTDIDGIPLTDGDLISPTVLTSNSGNATVLDLGDGRVIYIANDDALPGIDTFSYTINTASGSDSADVSVFVTDPGNLPEGSIVNGNSNDEDLIGVAENNTLFGDDGNDILYSLNGNDTLNGGDGSDILIAEGGSNLLTGGNDADLFVLTHEPQAGNDFEVITDIDTVEDDMILLAIEGLTNPDGSIAADRVSLFSAGSDSFLLADIDNDLANGNEAALARLDDLDSTTDPDALLASILANDLITV